jgi:AcrR family transcriptional regulator
MELFAAKGYDRTAVHEITDAVDVSERTFFRYFASKEDLVLAFIRDGAAAFAAALAARPAEEEPLTAARHALLSSILSFGSSRPAWAIAAGRCGPAHRPDGSQLVSSDVVTPAPQCDTNEL